MLYAMKKARLRTLYLRACLMAIKAFLNKNKDKNKVSEVIL